MSLSDVLMEDVSTLTANDGTLSIDPSVWQYRTSNLAEATSETVLLAERICDNQYYRFTAEIYEFRSHMGTYESEKQKLFDGVVTLMTNQVVLRECVEVDAHAHDSKWFVVSNLSQASQIQLDRAGHLCRRMATAAREIGNTQTCEEWARGGVAVGIVGKERADRRMKELAKWRRRQKRAERVEQRMIERPIGRQSGRACRRKVEDAPTTADVRGPEGVEEDKGMLSDEL